MRAAAFLAALVAIASCATGSESDPITTGPAVSASECIVSLHGKGGDGRAAEVRDGVAVLSPRGNDEGWGGRQWNYLDDEAYGEATAVVADTIDETGCEVVVVSGFSNGAAFAAKLLCRGETFGDRLVGIVIDDPVADEATSACERAAGVDATLYWTGALESTAPAGTDCGPIDWTCDGGVVVGIEAFAAAADLDVTASPFDEHVPFTDAPDPAAWLEAATS